MNYPVVMQAGFITLSCRSCGAKLEIDETMDRFVCAHCGTEMVAERRGGAVILKSVAEAVQKMQQAAGRTAAELAIVRLRGEITEKEKELEQSAAEAASVSYGFLGLLAAISLLCSGILPDHPWLGSFLVALPVAIGVLYYTGNRTIRRRAARRMEHLYADLEALRERLRAAEQVAGA